MDRLTLEVLAVHHPTAAVVFEPGGKIFVGQAWECAKCVHDYVSGTTTDFAEKTIRWTHIATLEEFATKPEPHCNTCGCSIDRVTDYDQWRKA